MSTRCNVIIKDGRDELIFYRHSDGYQEGALPTLKKFMEWVKQGKIRDNVEQASGWLIMIGAKEYEGYDNKDITQPTGDEESGWISGWKVGAYEPSTCIHGDIEYLYTLNLVDKTITVKDIYKNREEVIQV